MSLADAFVAVIEAVFPSNITLPGSGSDYFSTKELGINTNIIDVSENTSIQYTILTEIEDDLKEIIDEKYGSNDSFSDEWELFKKDYQINYYNLIK